MKYKLLFLLAFFTSCIYSQSEIPGYSFFSQEEKDLKECTFDKEADAVIFFDKAVSNYNYDYRLETERRIRFKILKESGIDKANITIPFYSENNFEIISDIEAVIMSLDDEKNWNMRSLDKKSIYTRKVGINYSEVSFTMPNVKVGSIIEYKYKSFMKHYGGLEDWYFQSRIPTMISTYDLSIPPNNEFAYSVKKSRFLPVSIIPKPEEGRIVFEMKNVPGLRDEPFMAARRDYIQRVVFQFSGSTRGGSYSTTWDELTRLLLGEKTFGGQIGKEVSGINDLKLLWANATDHVERVRLIFEHVRSVMTWDGIHSQESRDGVKDTWSRKKGSAGEINFVLLSLLKSADVEAFPMLVSEREHGKVDTTYPFRFQFNKTVVVAKAGGKTFILDATDKSTPWHLIPFDLLNTVGFIVDKKKGGFLRINDNNRKNMEGINIISVIDENGNIKARTSIYNYDYARLNCINKFGSTVSSQQEGFAKEYSNLKIDSFQIEGLEADTLPLKQVFLAEAASNKSGEYFWLNYNLFTGFDENPFLSNTRFTNIDFGCRYSCYVNNSYQLPANMVVESLPKSTRISTGGNTMSIVRTVEQKDNVITVGVKIDFNKSEFTAEEYSVMQNFYNQMFTILTEPIVLKSK